MVTRSSPTADFCRLASSDGQLLALLGHRRRHVRHELAACRGWPTFAFSAVPEMFFTNAVGEQLLHLRHDLLELAGDPVGGVEEAGHHAPVDVVAVAEVLGGVAGDDVGDGASQQARPT